jgi:DHA1 family tetracycline resistance protein-like MFS transporter
MLAGLAFYIASFIISGFASTGLVFWSGVPVGGLSGLSNPPMQGLMTRRVKPSEQGQLQGALSSIRGIAFMIGPILFTQIFADAIGPYRNWHLPGAPFLMAAILVAISMVIAWRVTTPRSEAETIASAQPAEAID